MLHGNSILHLVRKARLRTSDPVLLAVCAALEYEQVLHAAHKTNRACKACVAAYVEDKRRALKWYHKHPSKRSHMAKNR
jgi:hypothetical protein